jgi:hypothetical protein
VRHQLARPARGGVRDAEPDEIVGVERPTDEVCGRLDGEPALVAVEDLDLVPCPLEGPRQVRQPEASVAKGACFSTGIPFGLT